MTERTGRGLLITILVLFIGLGTAYALTTPTLEAPDEIYHYEYIRSLVNTGRPPVLERGAGRGFGHHAPLYYAYGAVVSFWVGERDWDVWHERHNPFFGYEFGEVGRDNKNLYLHPESDTFGQSDVWLGIRVIRLASVVLGAVTVWIIFQIGREVFPRHPEMAVGSAALAAFIPQFLFISGAVNDDNGATLFGALAIWAMMRILREGPTVRRCVGLGTALGLGWLSKLTVVALVPTAGLALALACWRDQSWDRLLRLALITFGITLLLAGPWLARQTLLYGDPTGTSREMTEWGLRENPLTLADLGPNLYWLRTSFWGRLGYNQIPLSNWIYAILDIVTLTAVVGLLRQVVLHVGGRPRFATSRLSQALSTPRISQLTVLTASFVFTFGPMIVRRFLRPMPNFGRYLFPVLPSVALLVFAGLAAWFPRRLHSLLAIGVAAGMLALGVTGVACFLAPAYARPRPLEDGSALTPDRSLDRTYLEDDKPLARLIGYDVDRAVVQPGETIHVTMYWEVVGETEVDYILFAQLFGRNQAKVGQRDTYPGLGHYPTSFWRSGEAFVDEIPIHVARDATGPSRLRLDIGLYQRGRGRLRVVNGRNEPIQNATIAWLKLLPTMDPPPPSTRVDYQVGHLARLTGYDLHQSSEYLDLALHWACEASTQEDYVIFVHLLNQDGDLVAQADGPPAGGDYPTSFWSVGEAIVDERIVDVSDVPPGTYRLYTGMYRLDNGERLPVTGAAGERLAHDALPLAQVQIP